MAADVDVTLLRIDPPVDARYLHTTYLLDLVETCGGRVANRPAGIRALHEKLVALRFPHLCPETVVTADPAVVRDLVARVGAAVVKPVDGFAGLDVWLLRDDDAAASLAESATRGGTRHVIAQAYLADVERGNKRLFLVDGEIVGAVLRRPSPTDFRIGPPVARAERRRRGPDDRRRPRAAARRARHRAGRAGRDRRPADRGQRDLPRRHAQDRRPAGHRPERRDHAPPPHHRTRHRRSPRMSTDTVAIVSIALLGILLFLLGANVTRHRAIRGDTGNQMPTDPADRMFIAQRAHGNAAEYVPTLIVLILVCASLSDGWWVQALAVAAVVSRSLHALGHADRRRPWRPTDPSATSAPSAPTSPASRSASPRSSRSR